MYWWRLTNKAAVPQCFLRTGRTFVAVIRLRKLDLELTSWWLRISFIKFNATGHCAAHRAGPPGTGGQVTGNSDGWARMAAQLASVLRGRESIDFKLVTSSHARPGHRPAGTGSLINVIQFHEPILNLTDVYCNSGFQSSWRHRLDLQPWLVLRLVRHWVWVIIISKVGVHILHINFMLTYLANTWISFEYFCIFSNRGHSHGALHILHLLCIFCVF